jgi:hypothetical protein
MQMAASYQVWGALLAPMAIPLLVGGAARLFGREIRIAPLEVLAVVAQKQSTPLLAGMALMRFAPAFLLNLSARISRSCSLSRRGLLMKDNSSFLRGEFSA